jgi:acetylornithine aminotransferase
MPLAKGLGSGVPIGAVVAGPKAASIFSPGNHGSTFGGNPLAMRAGVETIRIMERDGLLDNAAAMGRHFTEALQRELAAQLASGAVKDIRGRGLMIGIELAIPCSALMQKALDKGLLISVTAESVVRLVPPLIVSAAEVDAMVAILAPLIRDFLAANGAPA